MKKLLAICGIALGGLLSTAPASAVVVVSFTPSSTNIAIGESVTIDMSISGLGTEILSAFDFNAFWNSSVANWTAFNVTAGCDQLGAAPICGIDTVGGNNLGANGSSTLSDDDLAAIQPDSFLIARFVLSGAADGVTTFTLGPDLDFESNFVGRDFASLEAGIGSACISVGTGVCGGTPVPEPGTLALLGLGILGLGMSRRRRES